MTKFNGLKKRNLYFKHTIYIYNLPFLMYNISDSCLFFFVIKVYKNVFTTFKFLTWYIQILKNNI